MNKLTLIALLFSISAFSQSKQKIKEAKERREKYLFAAEATPKKFRTTVLGEFVLDEMLIPVTINGKTYHFIFDTGAVTIVSPELVVELGLKPVTSNEVIDAAGIKTQEKIFMIEAVELSGVTFSKIGCASKSFDSFSTALCRKVDGLLGTNIMRLGNCKIDYNTHSVTLSTDKIKPDFEYDTVDF
jgi:predicted aspartyl protease